MPETLEETGRSIGICKFISDDLLRYHFQSSDDTKIFHTVDLTAFECSGECSCLHFQIRIRPLIIAGLVKPHTNRAKCKHVERADKIFSVRMKREIVAHRDKPKR